MVSAKENLNEKNPTNNNPNFCRLSDNGTGHNRNASRQGDR